MKIIGGLVLIFGLYTDILAQNLPKIIPLEKQLAVSKADTQRGRLIKELEWLYAELPTDVAIPHLEKSLQIAQKRKDTVSERLLTYRLSHVYLYFAKDETQTMRWLNDCIHLAIKAEDNLILAHCYLLWSIVASHQKMDNTTSLINKAIFYAQKTHDWRINSEANIVMAAHYHAMKDLDKASLFAVKAMAFCENNDAKSWLSFALDYCDLLETQGKSAEMNTQLINMQKVAQTIKKDSKNYVLMNDLARLQTKLQNYENAERLYLEVLAAERAKSRPDTFHIYNIYRYLLPNYISQGDYKKAYNARTRLAEIELFLNQKRETESAKIQITKIQAAQEIALVKAEQKQQKLYLIGAIVVSLLVISLAAILWRSRQKTERQKAELAQLNNTKDKLFAILSHDLRSPVATLKNYMMLVDWGALNQVEFANTTKHLKNSLNNTHNMLENVLNWSITQLGGLKPRIEDVNVAEVINQQVQWQEAIAKEKNIEVTSTISSKGYLKIDKNHLAVIVRNLLQNALKFTPVNGEVIFDFYEMNGSKILTIKDSGPGIPQERLQTLFQINKEESNKRHSKEQGTGLGLVLVKELSELNKGNIEVESSAYQGTIFKITFG